MSNPSWPPEGHIAVGNYAFAPPLVPTELQLEQAEEFVFTQPTFQKLEEEYRRRNVIRLAIAAASSVLLGETESSAQLNVIPLIGGMVQMTTTRHEGTPVHSYTLMDGM